MEIFFLDEVTLPVNFFPRVLADARGCSERREVTDADRLVVLSFFPFFRSPRLADGGRPSSEIKAIINNERSEEFTTGFRSMTFILKRKSIQSTGDYIRHTVVFAVIDFRRL